KRNAKGQTVRQQAEAQAAAGFTVWRSYDQPGGIRDELYSIAAKNPNIVKLEVIGKTIQGRDILALKVTKNARAVADGSRPSSSTWGRSTRVSGSRPKSSVASSTTSSTTTTRTPRSRTS